MVLYTLNDFSVFMVIEEQGSRVRFSRQFRRPSSDPSSEEPSTTDEPAATTTDNSLDSLQARIQEHGSYLLLGKVPNARTDYVYVAKHNLDDVDKDGLDTIRRVTGLVENIRREEVLTYSDDLSFAEGDYGFVKYLIYADQRDGWGREHRSEWVVLAPSELCNDIVSFARENPEQTFDLFFGLIEKPTYTGNLRDGKLHVFNLNGVPETDDGEYKRELDGLFGSDRCESIEYELSD
jgi:hypothetical protein